jgi:hypothetical protein
MSKIPNDKQHKVTIQFSRNAKTDFPGDAFDIRETNQLQQELQGGDVSIEALLELREWLENVGQEKRPCIQHAPGFRLVEFLGNLCHNTTLEKRLKPLHAEYLALHYEALKEKQYGKARWLKLQMRAYLVYTVFDEIRALFKSR